MTIWTRSKASGAASKTSPTAPHSKALIGSPPGTGTSDGADGVRPVIVVGSYADGETAFILPLAIASKLGIRRLCWFGQEQCDYNAPLSGARFFAARCARALPRRLARTASSKCSAIRGCATIGSSWRRCRKWSAPRPIRSSSLDVTANASGAHLTQLGDDWEKFYFAKRSSATRRRDRAKRRHMSEYGEIRFVTATEVDDARRTLETLIDQKHRAFARRGIRDIFARPGLREFFLDLASNPKIRHRFHISRVEVGDTWAAANFAILFGDCYYHVLASYEDDAAVSHYGPGALHLRELLAHAIKLGLRRFDFTIGDEPYKDEWSDTSVKLYDHSAAATWRGWPVSAASTARRRLKRFVKQTPSLWKLVSRLRATLGALTHPKASQRQPARRAAPPRRSRNRRSPASWATWICCSRSRRPAFPAPW